MPSLTKSDYKSILKFYKMKIPKSNKTLKQKAEQILREKLCRCIKKLDVSEEARAIGICTKTIIGRKGFKRGKFTCKKGAKIELSKKK